MLEISLGLYIAVWENCGVCSNMKFDITRTSSSVTVMTLNFKKEVPICYSYMYVFNFFNASYFSSGDSTFRNSPGESASRFLKHGAGQQPTLF